jgi:acyl carrier protein
MAPALESPGLAPHMRSKRQERSGFHYRQKANREPHNCEIKRSSYQGTPVPTTFDRVADIIASTSEIDRDKITPESHTIDDLGIDSLDFLDIVFAIDKEFGIKVPLEKWTQDVNEGRGSTEEYFVMKNLCAKIDQLVAAKAASA